MKKITNSRQNHLLLIPKQVVEHFGQEYEIIRILDLDSILAKNCENGQMKTLLVKDLKPRSTFDKEEEATPSLKIELSLISQRNWDEARRRFDVIHPLIGVKHRRTEKEVKARADECGLHTVTVYRWIKLYEDTGEVSALLSNKSGYPTGKTRISPEVEAIVQGAIENVYLKNRRRSVGAVRREIERLCKIKGDLPIPNNKTTIRRKINLVSRREQVTKRHSHRTAREEFDPIRGEFPHAEYPLAVVQIDHTKLDVMIVDEVYRQSIGRPWITLAIDVFSRVVIGFSISLDAPSNLSVGLCLTQAILPKETWLERVGVDGNWDCWGFPKTIHADNAKEFRGEMLRRACEEYGINLEWRPIGKPHYGGHIERLMGTFNEEVHDLPGTTFSNPSIRKDYDSEKEAVMTLREIEKWLAMFIVGVYHERVHDGIKTTPLERWREGIMGSDERPGTGLPPRVTDTDKLRLDFLPAISRTVQQYGVQLDDVYYYHDILRQYVNAKDEKNPRLKKSFVFKRDPRDISEIYFYDEKLKQYFAVPYRDTSRPAMSLWELREIKSELKKQGKSKVNEISIFETREKMREQEEQSTKLTKTARRKKERRLIHQTNKPPRDIEKVSRPDNFNELLENNESSDDSTTESVINSSGKKRRIRPFDDLEYL